MPYRCACQRAQCRCLQHSSGICGLRTVFAKSLCKACRINVPEVKSGPNPGVRKRPAAELVGDLEGACDDVAGPSLPVLQDAAAPRGVIHRIWIQTEGSIEGPTRFPALALESIRSFAGMAQWIWTWGPLSSDALAVEGCTRRDMSVFMHKLAGKWLLDNNVPVQCLKDGLAFLIAYNYGGWFIDLDYLWLGRTLPDSGLVFGEEPAKNSGWGDNRDLPPIPPLPPIQN